MESLAKTLEAATVAMVQDAPTIDVERYEAAACMALQFAIAATNSTITAGTALAIEFAIDGVRFGDIALAAGLPAIAMSAATLATTSNHHMLHAETFTLETLFPNPLTGRRPTMAEPTPDVDISRLSRQGNDRDNILARRRAPMLSVRAIRLAACDIAEERARIIVGLRDRYNRSAALTPV